EIGRVCVAFLDSLRCLPIVIVLFYRCDGALGLIGMATFRMTCQIKGITVGRWGLLSDRPRAIILGNETVFHPGSASTFRGAGLGWRADRTRGEARPHDVQTA